MFEIFSITFFNNACIIVIHALFLHDSNNHIMTPIDFKEGNKILYKPQIMSDEECSPLLVFTDNRECISCWKPSFSEKVKILFNGKVWLGVLSGSTQPPVFITADYPFVKPKPHLAKRFYGAVIKFTNRIFKCRKGAKNG